MVDFSPPELREELSRALSIWNERIKLDTLDGIPPSEEWDELTPEGHENQVLSEKTAIHLYLNGMMGNSMSLTLRQFIDTMDELVSAKLLTNSECRTSKRILVRVAPRNDTAVNLLRHVLPDIQNDEEAEKRLETLRSEHDKIIALRKNIQEHGLDAESILAHTEVSDTIQSLRYSLEEPNRRFCSTKVSCEGQAVDVCLTTGVTMFGLVAFCENLYSDYDPLFRRDEPFIELRFTREVSDECKRGIINAYLFELAGTLDARFSISPRIRFEENYEGILSDVVEVGRMRSLMLGKGMTDLLELNVKAFVASDPEIQILYCVKVVEYVAQTVIHQQAIQRIRSKLLSPQALSPDAAFITELKAIVSKSEKAAEDDREAIKQTILRCCDATELAKVAPSFLPEFKSKKLASDQNAQNTALGKFAQSLYSTRNAIAHAKSNYTPTGSECPREELGGLAKCAQVAAQQVVRWFHSTPEDVRAVEND